MKKYTIDLHGCDDSTYIEMELNKEQIDFVKLLSKLSKEQSRYSCMPILELEEIKS